MRRRHSNRSAKRRRPTALSAAQAEPRPKARPGFAEDELVGNAVAHSSISLTRRFRCRSDRSVVRVFSRARRISRAFAFFPIRRSHQQQMEDSDPNSHGETDQCQQRLSSQSLIKPHAAQSKRHHLHARPPSAARPTPSPEPIGEVGRAVVTRVVVAVVIQAGCPQAHSFSNAASCRRTAHEDEASRKGSRQAVNFKWGPI